MRCIKFSGLWMTKGSPKPVKKTWPRINNQEKKQNQRTCHVVDFAILVDHRNRIKEREKTTEKL